MATIKYKIKSDYTNIIRIFDEQSTIWHHRHPYTYEKHYSTEDWLVLEIFQQTNIVFRAWIKPEVREIDMQYCITRKCELDFLNKIMKEVEEYE